MCQGFAVSPPTLEVHGVIHSTSSATATAATRVVCCSHGVWQLVSLTVAAVAAAEAASASPAEKRRMLLIEPLTLLEITSANSGARVRSRN